jgi:ubiquinone/menaquinone biosynthesis C-methylase UbiE
VGQDHWRQSAQKFYDNEARYKKDPGHYRTLSRAYHKAADALALSPQSSILDLGCGCGEMAHALRDQVRSYCGIDISWDSLVVAQERNASSLFVQADMTALPFSTKFDFAIAMTSLEFVYNKPAALRGIRRVLKDSGKLYIEVRNADFLLFKLFSPVMEHLIRLGLVIPYEAEGFRDLGFAGWKELLTEEDFQVVELKKSLRPIMCTSLAAYLKSLLIKAVGLITSIKYHYMVGFLCVKKLGGPPLGCC